MDLLQDSFGRCMAKAGEMLGESQQLSAPPLNAIVTMDPGQDLDDEMFMVLSAALTARRALNVAGVVTCLAPAGMRARLARGTMDQLGLPEVHVAAGTDGGASGDAESIAKMASVDYLTRLPPQEEAGLDLMSTLLQQAEPKSMTVVVIASLKDVARLLKQEEALCVDKVKQVIIMGGVEPFVAGDAPAGTFLVPDTAHNNEFDKEASVFTYRRLQELGIPLVVVSRFLAYACQVPKSIYDRMAATGSRIGKHLQWAQRNCIESLWQRSCAPEGSLARNGLPERCNREWFVNTFCGGMGKADGAPLTADASIWDHVVAFNMYDPLALCVAVPSLQHLFDPDTLVVNGTAHRVYGVSKERTGVKDPAALREWLIDAFMQGIHQSQTADESAEKAEIRALRAEVNTLRAEVKLLRKQQQSSEGQMLDPGP
jgi:hypothetical protein